MHPGQDYHKGDDGSYPTSGGPCSGVVNGDVNFVHLIKVNLLGFPLCSQPVSCGEIA